MGSRAVVGFDRDPGRYVGGLASSVPEEGTMSTLRALGEVSRRKVCSARSIPRGSLGTRRTPGARSTRTTRPSSARHRADRGLLAGGPGAVGAIFGTLQTRLPQELRLAGSLWPTPTAFSPSLVGAQRALRQPGGGTGHRLRPVRRRSRQHSLPPARARRRQRQHRALQMTLQIPFDRHHYVKARVRVHHYPGSP